MYNSGYIYIAANDVDIYMLKIGKTTQNPYDRVKSLNTTGVVHPLKLMKYYSVVDIHRAERLIHRHLESYRYRSDREFFKVDLQYADEQIIKLLSSNRLFLSSGKYPDNSDNSNQSFGYYTNSDNRATVLLVCMFFGLIGLHHFIWGKARTGLIYFFTIGVFGIGWFVDLLLIMFGKSSLISEKSTWITTNNTSINNDTDNYSNLDTHDDILNNDDDYYEEEDPDDEPEDDMVESSIYKPELTDLAIDNEDDIDIRKYQHDNVDIYDLSVNFKYKKPSIDLLDCVAVISNYNNGGEENSTSIVSILANYGVNVEQVGLHVGYSVDFYEIKQAPGVKINDISALTKEIALSLNAFYVDICPNYEKAVLNVIAFKNESAFVPIRAVLQSDIYHNQLNEYIVPLGIGINEDPLYVDMLTNPHLMIFGNSNTGKSRLIHSFLISLMIKSSPEHARFFMMDSKGFEYNVYRISPFLVTDNISNPNKVLDALQWLMSEMDRRYYIFQDKSARSMIEYHEFIKNDSSIECLPAIYIVIDDFIELISPVKDEALDFLIPILSKGSIVGINLIVASSSLSSKHFINKLKGYFGSRICFKVNTKEESLLVLDNKGAENLYSNGDLLLYKSGSHRTVRCQSLMCSDKEIEFILQYVNNENSTPDMINTTSIYSNNPHVGIDDDLFLNALKIVIETGYAAVSLIQRRMNIGYPRAARLIDMMHEKGYIGPFIGARPREVLITKEEYDKLIIEN